MQNDHGEHSGKDTHADNEYEIFHCTQIRHTRYTLSVMQYDKHYTT